MSERPTRRGFAARPADPEQWIKTADVSPRNGNAAGFTARLTIDVTPDLRGRIKIAAFRRGVIALAQSSAAARNWLGLVSEQSLYNLSERTVELEVIPALRHLGIGLIPWSPIGMGLLGGVLRKQAEGRAASPLTQMRIEKYRPRLEAYEAFCDELGETPTNVALAWLLHNPVVSAVIGAPRTVEQFRQNLKAPTVTLSTETLAKLDEIWPGPGGEAPMAYAW